MVGRKGSGDCVSGIINSMDKPTIESSPEEETNSSPAWRTRKTLYRWILFFLLVCTVGISLRPYFVSQMKKVHMVRATGNAKQIYMLMIDFDQDHGRFPDASTASKIKTDPNNPLPLNGSSSNAYFRQLIAGGYVPSENIFYAKTKHSHKPDDNIKGVNAIAPGECGYAYVTGMEERSPSNAPILVAPLIPGTTTFDSDLYLGKAVVLRIDGSAKAELIAPDGHVYVDGMDIFDPRQSFWGGKAPVIAYPE